MVAGFEVSPDRTTLSCTQNRARLQILCAEISALRRELGKGPLTTLQSQLLQQLYDKCELLWEAATVRLSHDELQTEDGQAELLIMDQCPIGRPLG